MPTIDKPVRLFDSQEVLRAITLLTTPGQVFEYRALNATEQRSNFETVYYGYFDDPERLIQSLPRIATAMGSYITLHPVDDDLLSRSANRIQQAKKITSKKESGATTDNDTTSYSWLPIDCDPIRKAGISSTNNEHDLALARAASIRDTLTSLGWPTPIAADSGNGAHLLYKINLPVSEQDLVKRAIDGIAERYGDKVIEVDQSVFNPSRIWKLYGTLACKGDSTTARPHRMSRILHAPDDIIEVTREQLEQIAVPVPVEAPKTSNNIRQFPSSSNRLTSPKDLLDRCHIGYTEVDGKFILDTCVFDSTHTGKDAAVFEKDGKWCYKCFHNSCRDKSWADFRKVLEPDYEPYDPNKTTKAQQAPPPKHNNAKKNAAPIESSATSGEKPAFIIEGQMREQVQKALGILKSSNDIQPKIFIYLSYISEVAADENGNPIIMQIERAGLRNALNDAADFFKWKVQKDEDPVLVDAHPPKDLADQMLAMAPSKWPLPPLKAIVEAPVLRPDGSILDKPGYDAKTHLYYVPSAGMEKCKIPINPTKDDAIKSMDFLKKIFVDFPFEGKPDLANTIALLFTPFVRYAVTKDIQMALIDATNAGTGKGLISICISIVATGKTTTPMTAKRDDDEWRKAILTELLQAPRIVIIDNIRGTLDSPALELMLTGNGINERILGQSKSAKPKNEATWMATGNNLLIGGDLPRRCYRIRLISPTATPEERDDFEIKDLEQWTGDHRGEIVTAILTVARAWYVAGKPQPKKVPSLGTFTDWVKTVGGMLEFAGIEGFQGNRDDLRSKNNEEAKEWEAFLSSWSDFYGDTWKSASDVAEDLKSANDPYPKPPATANEPTAKILLEVLPQYLKTALAEKPKSFAVVLPIQLGKRVQTVYGSQAFHIEKDEDSHTKVKVWKVKRGVAVGSPGHTGNEKKSSFQSVVSDIAHGYVNPPQPTAPTAKHPFNADQELAQSSTTGSSTGYQEETKQNEFAGGSKNIKKVMTPSGNGFLTGSVRNTERGELVGVLINQIEEFHPKSNCYPVDDQVETA